MWSKVRIVFIITALAFIMNVLPSAAVFATETPAPPATSQDKASPAPPQKPAVTASQSATPQDTRVLTPQEVKTYKATSDSLAQTGQVQQMNVGAEINGTLVLSILVALVIFAVLVAIL